MWMQGDNMGWSLLPKGPLQMKDGTGIRIRMMSAELSIRFAKLELDFSGCQYVGEATEHTSSRGLR